jgi:uncharacterized protein
VKLAVNLRLAREEAQQLAGEAGAEDLGVEAHDDLVRFEGPVAYDLEAEMHAENLFVHGNISFTLRCGCGRCLKEFDLPVVLADFAALVPLTGEDALPVEGDFGDLTPLLREDIYLALPTNPLCGPRCRGLSPKRKSRDSRLGQDEKSGPSPWSALDRLNL